MAKKLHSFLLASLVATTALFADGASTVSTEKPFVADVSVEKQEALQKKADAQETSEKKVAALSEQSQVEREGLVAPEGQQGELKKEETLNKLEGNVGDGAPAPVNTSNKLKEEMGDGVPAPVNTSLFVAAKAFIVTHPVIATTALTVTTVAAIVAIYKWHKASSQAKELEEELEALEKLYN